MKRCWHPFQCAQGHKRRSQNESCNEWCGSCAKVAPRRRRPQWTGNPPCKKSRSPAKLRLIGGLEEFLLWFGFLEAHPSGTLALI